LPNLKIQKDLLIIIAGDFFHKAHLCLNDAKKRFKSLILFGYYRRKIDFRFISVLNFKGNVRNISKGRSNKSANLDLL